MSNRVIIDQTVNTVTTDQCPTIHNSVVVNNDTPSIIGVTENVTNIVTVAVPGPQGPAGAPGPSGSSILNQITSGSVTASVNIGPTIFSVVSGSSTYLTVSSSGSLSVNGNATITGSLTVTQGITSSLFGTASWALNAITASYVPASAVVGLNLSRIATGSVSASVSLGSGSFELVSGSTSLLFVSSSGNVGIGTNTPTAKLQVNNSVVGDSLKINGATNTSLTFNTDAFGRAFIGVSGNTSATSAAGAYFTADGYQEAWFNVVARSASTNNKYWRFGNIGTGGISNLFAIQKLNDAADNILFTALSISSFTGNVSINSTSDSGERFQVYGSSRLVGNTVISGSTTITSNLSVGGATTISGLLQTPGGIFCDNNLARFRFITVGVNQASGTGWIQTEDGSQSVGIRTGVAFGGTQRLLVTGTGLVAIGSHTPTALLHISGSTGGLLQVDSPTSPNTLFVSASGNVGIGTNTPLYKLDVAGNIRAGTGGNNGIVYSQAFTNTATDGYLYFGTGDRAFGTGGSNIYFGSGYYGQAAHQFYGGTATGMTAVVYIAASQATKPALQVEGRSDFSGSLTVTQGITGSLLGTSSWAQNAVTASSADNFLVRGTLTAQTIVAQTITSSTDFVTGSTKFGSLLSNTHQFTGSVSITGSLTLPYLSNGSVLFAGATDDITEDNANFFWDNTNKRLGIGTNAPASRLHIRQTAIDGNNSLIMTSNAVAANIISFRNPDNSSQGGFLATGNSYAYGTYQANQATLAGGSGGIGLRVANTTGTHISFYGGNSDADFAIKYFQMSGNTGNILLQNGGTFTDSGDRLQVSGSSRFTGNMTITGSSNTSATNALTVVNSSNANLLTVRNDGLTVVGGQLNVSSLIYGAAGNITIEPGNSFASIRLKTFEGNSTIIANADIFQPTTINVTSLVLNQVFSPTSGTATYTSTRINPTINQTGGANGITRGLHVNPTLSSVSDWRSIEWSNNASGSTSWGLYGAGTAPNFLSGSLGIGTTSSLYRLDVAGDARIQNALLIGSTTTGFTFSSNTITTYTNSFLGIPSDRFFSITDTSFSSVYFRVIRNTGAILIGTTADDGVNRLQVSGSSRFVGDMIITGSGLRPLSITSAASGVRLAINQIGGSTNAGISLSANDTGKWSLAHYIPAGTNTSFVFYNDQTGTNSLFINGDNNNVGIGTATPTARLDVSGSSRFQGNMTVSGALNVGNTNIEFQENTNVTSGSWRVVSSEPTASYKAAFFDYVMFSGSVARAGTVYSVWSASYAEFYENYTGDVGGSTSGVTLQAAISGSNIQLQATASNSSWTIRSLVRML